MMYESEMIDSKLSSYKHIHRAVHKYYLATQHHFTNNTKEDSNQNIQQKGKDVYIPHHKTIDHITNNRSHHKQ